jgi:hypothetical protein
MPRWKTTKTHTRWCKHQAPALAGVIQGLGEVNRLSMGRVGCLAAQGPCSKRDVKSVVAGTLPCGTNHVPTRLDTPLPPGLSPEFLHGAAHPAAGSSARTAVALRLPARRWACCASRSASYAGVRPDGLAARLSRARIESCSGHTALRGCPERMHFDNLSKNHHESPRR